MRFDLFSSGRLYAALRDAGYPDLPAERTLRDWIKQDSAPTGARLFVAQLIGADTTKEAAPPEWAERLQERIDAVYARQMKVGEQMAGKVIEALAPLERLEVMDDLAAWLLEAPRTSSEVPPESHDTEVRDAEAPEGQASS